CCGALQQQASYEARGQHAPPVGKYATAVTAPRNCGTTFAVQCELLMLTRVNAAPVAQIVDGEATSVVPIKPAKVHAETRATANCRTSVQSGEAIAAQRAVAAAADCSAPLVQI